MGQVSRVLRRSTTGYLHWCPACEEMHQLPDAGWTFDGNLERPTFRPSFKHESRDPKLQGLDSPWKHSPHVCHYNLVGGVLMFVGDCTHAYAGKSVPLPDLPKEHRDEP